MRFVFSYIACTIISALLVTALGLALAPAIEGFANAAKVLLAALN